MNRTAGGSKAALINQTLARQHFGNQNPIGQQIATGLPQSPSLPWMTIVGVVADVKHEVLEKEGHPTMYMPKSWPSMALVVRAQSNPLSLVSGLLRSEVRRLDREGGFNL